MNETTPIGGRSAVEEASLDRELYFSDHYFSSDQLTSLCAQIQHVHARRPKRILEVGLGNGFVSSYLSSAGYDVTTMDINANLNPDVVGDISELDTYFKPGEFDLILCAEVLEHMPLEDSIKAMKKMSIVSSRHVLITLPRSQKIVFDLQFFLKLPKCGRVFRGFFLSLPRRRSNIPNHHWELDSRDECSMSEIRKVMEKYFMVANIEREKLNPYHYFFSLETR